MNVKTFKTDKISKYSWYVKIALLCICVGIIIEFLFVTNFQEFNAISRIDAQRIARDVYSQQNDCIKEGNELITSSNDSWIELQDINAYVGFVEIKLNQPVEHSWELKMYYTSESVPYYTEEYSVYQWVSKDDKRIIIELNSNIKNLRIDLGNEKDTSFSIKSIVCNPLLIEYCLSVYDLSSLVRIFVYSLMGFVGVLLFKKKLKIEQIYKWRWGIGAFVVVFCVIFKLHGSSVDMYSIWLPGYDYEPVFGEPRSIRSDEYLVFTQMAFSQVAQKFPWFNNSFRNTFTDMFMIFGQPVQDISMIFRPAQIGYFFLGAERGLSFYWAIRLVGCFLVSLEFGKLITKKNLKYSFIYALLICFAPVIQWWYSVNSIVEIFVFGQGIVLLFINFLVEKKFYRKILNFMGVCICAGGYLLCMYPAWQIPLFYVFLICGISSIVERYKEGAINLSVKDGVVGGLLLTVLIILMFRIIYQSRDVIFATMNTVYPGDRNILGGNLKDFPQLFKSWANIFLPITGENIVQISTNECESAVFIDFFPLGIIFSLYVSVKSKFKDIWLNALSILNAIFLSFFLLQWPEFLSKITLLNQCPTERVLVAISFLNLILLIRTVSIDEDIKIGKKFYAVILIVLFFVFAYYEQYLELQEKIVVFLIVVVSIYVWNNRKCVSGKGIVVWCITMSLLSGVVVNPVCQSVNSLYDNPIVRHIEKINKDKPGTWAVATDTFVFNNLPTIFGAKTINSVHTYPNSELWDKLELEDQEEDWNRYAHIILNVSEESIEEASLELLQSDLIRINLDLGMLKDLGVDYILSNKDLGYAVDDVDCLYNYEGFYIYRLIK